MTAPTKAQIERARAIAADIIAKEGMTSIAEQIRRGRRDGLDTVKAALAAIIETQEACAKLVETYQGPSFGALERIAAAIREGIDQ